TKRSELEKNFGTNYEKSEIIKDMIIEQEIERDIQGELSPRTMNALWMLILLQLSKICSDVRRQVRNGANQTLFRTIDMNGAGLESQTWHTCIWKIMVHHSRNTVDKQWDETKVLVLTGMSGIIKNFLPFLINLEDFKQAWELFLLHLQESCLYSSLEVAFAAIKSLNTIIQFPEDEIHSNLPKKSISLLFKNAWITWERI
ncbi:18998_t:CDS:2, partial [Dentiscutata erythropus]